jgi:hypothetical protein
MPLPTNASYRRGFFLLPPPSPAAPIWCSCRFLHLLSLSPPLTAFFCFALWQQRWLVVAGCCCELLRKHEHMLLTVLLGWLFGLVAGRLRLVGAGLVMT